MCNMTRVYGRVIIQIDFFELAQKAVNHKVPLAKSSKSLFTMQRVTNKTLVEGP